MDREKSRLSFGVSSNRLRVATKSEKHCINNIQIIKYTYLFKRSRPAPSKLRAKLDTPSTFSGDPDYVLGYFC